MSDKLDFLWFNLMGRFHVKGKSEIVSSSGFCIQIQIKDLLTSSQCLSEEGSLTAMTITVSYQ